LTVLTVLTVLAVLAVGFGIKYAKYDDKSPFAKDTTNQ
jgi:hypothetical protein